MNENKREHTNLSNVTKQGVDAIAENAYIEKEEYLKLIT